MNAVSRSPYRVCCRSWADAIHYLYFTDHLILGEIDGELVDILDVPAVFGVGEDFFAFLYLNDSSENK